MILHAGGCHCRKVRFEVRAPADIEVDECNCSICGMSGFLHLIVPADRFRILCGADSLVSYRFNTHTATHLFCATCGIKPFYVPRSHPDGYSVNVRCIDAGTIASVRVHRVDGREWDKAYPQGRGEFR